ncbi:hypothetical protein MYU51_005589 [Penicillium brevicompactum]
MASTSVSSSIYALKSCVRDYSDAQRHAQVYLLGHNPCSLESAVQAFLWTSLCDYPALCPLATKLGAFFREITLRGPLPGDLGVPTPDAQTLGRCAGHTAGKPDELPASQQNECLVREPNITTPVFSYRTTGFYMTALARRLGHVVRFQKLLIIAMHLSSLQICNGEYGITCAILIDYDVMDLCADHAWGTPTCHRGDRWHCACVACLDESLACFRTPLQESRDLLHEAWTDTDFVTRYHKHAHIINDMNTFHQK